MTYYNKNKINIFYYIKINLKIYCRNQLNKIKFKNEL